MTIQETQDLYDGLDPAASLASIAYERIKVKLIMLDIRPGSPINDGALAAELGVGRTPVREALKRLETDHLVVSYSRRGTFATTVDVTELGAISDIRQLLEPHAARRAAENATPRVRAELRDAAEKVRHLEIADGDRNNFLREDMSVHHLIYRASGNAHLENVLIRYDNLATRIHCMFLDRLTTTDMHIVAEHVALLRAIAAGEADRADELAREHILGFERAIRAVI